MSLHKTKIHIGNKFIWFRTRDSMRGHKRRNNGIFMKMDALTKLNEVLSVGLNTLKEDELLLLAHEVTEK